MKRLSLHARILAVTAIAVTLLFTATGLLVQRHTVSLIAESLEEEMRTGFRAYEELWKAREEMLSSISLLLGRMPDVRAAFSTGDAATIRDTASEVWNRIARDDALFAVCDPQGRVIALLGGEWEPGITRLDFVELARARFPAQAAGFHAVGSRFYQVVVTPVYVSSPREPVLINVLVAAFAVDERLAQRLEASIPGVRFVFHAGDRIIAARGKNAPAGGAFQRELKRPLRGLDGRPAGELRIIRALESAPAALARLRRDVVLIWAAALALALFLAGLLFQRMLRPLAELDAAAREISQGNFDFAVEPKSEDEIGRLARTFNAMRESLKEARQQLIRQERLSTIGRLSTSLVHDLRNPLAAVYGGAEMLMDAELTPEQVRRLAASIYRSSRRIQSLLAELQDVGRGAASQMEPCRVLDLVQAALEDSAELMQRHGTQVRVEVDPEVSVRVARATLERVVTNLLANAAEAMPNGGEVFIRAEVQRGRIVLTFQDTGPGVPAEIRDRLFEPFVSHGKRDGLGLGLALSRKIVQEHGGDLWFEPSASGACFRLALPLP
ncbi:MAG: ATP-binding protein [Acidobacteriota bacterium]